MRKKIIIAVILIVSAGGLFGYNIYRLNKSIPVVETKAAEGVIKESVYANGKLESVKESVHYIPYTGTVDTVSVKPGDKVQAGQSLLRMSTEDWEDQIRLEQNNREMIVAEQNGYRKKALESARQELKAGKEAAEVFDEDELDVYRLRLERSNMTIEGLQKKLSSRELKAELDGVVTEVAAESGQTVSQGMAAIKTIKADELRVKAYLNELDAGKVKHGMEATVTGDAFEGSFQGTLSYLAPIAAPADPTSKDPSVELWVDLNNEAEALRPGFNAIIEIVVSEEPHLLLPLSAIRQKGDQAFVFQVKDGTAAQIEVKIGKDDGENIEILDGLKAGEQVIAELPDALSDGKKVKLQ